MIGSCDVSLYNSNATVSVRVARVTFSGANYTNVQHFVAANTSYYFSKTGLASFYSWYEYPVRIAWD